MSWKARKGWKTQVAVVIDGETKKVKRGDDFIEAIEELADVKGWSNYRVFVDGDEIDPDDAPDDFEGIDEVKISKYDEAGN